MKTRNIFCCTCDSDVSARLTSGVEIYPHRPDLGSLPFWRCDMCGNFVGCHHKTADRTRPLGNIPTEEIRKLRRQIHAELDPLWKTGKMRRKYIYARLTAILGHQYHTAELASADEGRIVLDAIRVIAKERQASEKS